MSTEAIVVEVATAVEERSIFVDTAIPTTSVVAGGWRSATPVGMATVQSDSKELARRKRASAPF
jgi:hypothetical protein